MGDGTGVGAPVLAGDGTAGVARGAAGADESHPALPVGLGTGVGLPPVAVGAGATAQGASAGTATAVAPARPAVGVAVPVPAATGLAVGAAGPGVTVSVREDVVLGAGRLGPGWLGTALGELGAAAA